MVQVPSLPERDVQLKRAAGPIHAGQAARPAAAELDERDDILACAGCLRRITTAAARIAIGGRHAHTRVNPHGVLYEFGCFASATGCHATGDPTTEWSWFPGYCWQIESCDGCQAHLGWLFSAPDSRFHGLILDRLIEFEERS